MFKIFKQYHILSVFAVIAILAMSGCFSASTKSKSATHIEFENTEVNMGNLIQHHPDTATFSFKNTGNTPLVIYSAEASCGCTQPEYPGEPVSPGEKGEIKVTYDARAPGKFIKSITIYHNGENNFDIIEINGTVVASNNTN
jgi:hypothetical protein